MTWKEIKDKIEELGVKDNDEIVDINIIYPDNFEISIDEIESNVWSIKN